VFPGKSKLAAYGVWAAFFLLFSWGQRHVKKSKDAERPTLFDRFFMGSVLFFVAPVTYLWCMAAFALLISDAVTGASSVGLWIGLVFSFFMLNGPRVLLLEIRTKQWVEAGKPARSRENAPTK
jgi:threonine/homoserine/homoserine lactone efflux protein